MKKVLFMVVVELFLGGVLIFGDCGIGKLMVVCVLVEFLFKIDIRIGCWFNCSFGIL